MVGTRQHGHLQPGLAHLGRSQSKVRWSKSLVFGVGPPWTALATKPTPTLRHCDARQLSHAEANRERDRGGDLFFPIPGLGSQVK